ncbi:uracil-DNA glycosylase [Rickettsiales bacterium]|nr:uracil-DNA glycosylase [Rickettsiales bacterium]
MDNIKQILHLYRDNDLNELISENPINRFLKTDKVDINKSIDIKDNVNKEKDADVFIENKKNIINNNSGNMAQAIEKLIKKQTKIENNKGDSSIQDIIDSARNLSDQVKDLEELQQVVHNFEGCNLKKMATNTVFSDGDSSSKIMIIGEAPGNHEDLQGIPFCGDSGKLLDSMFAAIGYPRQDLYITNTIFWRPPGNRKPTKEELAICHPFVEKHIGLVEPELIVLMGSTAMVSISEVKDPIGQVRGKFMDYSNQYLSNSPKVISLFHPSYLMRQPSKKRLAWEDLLMIKDFLNKNNG